MVHQIKPRSLLFIAALWACFSLTAVAAETSTAETSMPVKATFEIMTDGSESLTDSSKININTATAAELTRLSGIGKTKADQIVAWRNENGLFTEPGQLTQVKGIGQNTLHKIRDQISIE